MRKLRRGGESKTFGPGRTPRDVPNEAVTQPTAPPKSCSLSPRNLLFFFDLSVVFKTANSDTTRTCARTPATPANFRTHSPCEQTAGGGCPAWEVASNRRTSRSASMVSFTVAGLDSRDAAAILDGSFGIETRAGLHCAPRIHRALGTERLGGTIRVSPGPFNTPDQIDAVIAAVADLAS